MIENIDILLNYFRRCNTATTDSRKIHELKNEGRKVMFFALKGENFDGNDYVTAALEDGADFVVTDSKAFDDAAHKKILVVPDSLRAMQNLARAYRRSLPVKVVAITGTNGKTTTKELSLSALSKKYKTYATSGNLNNHIGVPLTLLNMPRETEVAIIEMGASHVGEIRRLCAIAEPNYGLITNIGRAHLEGFGSIEGIKQAKGELYDFIKLSGGIALYDSSNKVLSDMINDRGGIRKSSYNSNDAKASLNDFGELVVSFKGKSLDIHTNLTGEYNSANIAAAYAISRLFGIEYMTFADAIEGYTPKNNRSQLIHTKNNIIIADAYNANPSSMSCAIDNLCAAKGSSKIAILGAMKELGEASEDEHRTIIDKVTKLNLTEVFFIGEEYISVKDDEPRHKYFSSTEDFMEILPSLNLSGSTILIKGSRSMSLEKVIDIISK